MHADTEPPQRAPDRFQQGGLDAPAGGPEAAGNVGGEEADQAGACHPQRADAPDHDVEGRLGLRGLAAFHGLPHHLHVEEQHRAPKKHEGAVEGKGRAQHGAGVNT